MFKTMSHPWFNSDTEHAMQGQDNQVAAFDSSHFDNTLSTTEILLPM